MPRKLHVAIDCRITDFQQGIGTALLALAKAFSDSNVENQHYTFIAAENAKGLLDPYIYGPCVLESVTQSTLSKAKRAIAQIAPLRSAWNKLTNNAGHIPRSNGYIESRKFDLVHFPTQLAYATKLPSIYQPHDLQHLHYPQFFSKGMLAKRERLYRTFCNRASFVCVQTEWTRKDIINQYHLPADKVVVIPWGSVFEAYSTPSTEEIRNTVDKYNLPKRFFVYPAVTWPHKNQEIIFRALQILKRQHGIVPHVFFTGALTDYRSTLDKVAQYLGISEQVHFLGFVSPKEMQSILGVATGMIYPSRFEGFGLPILEAFQALLPVLSSNATTLPEVAGDGALYFDPDSPKELSVMMRDILERPELRQNLIEKGKVVLSRYSFRETALRFNELYERTADLSGNPMAL